VTTRANMPLNGKQRIVAVLGAFLVALTGLVPPWRSGDVAAQSGRGFGSMGGPSPGHSGSPGPWSRIWHPPSSYFNQIDLARLGIEWAVLVVVVGILLVILRDRK
jgi:hypothetical protein